jgi:hypothetical protein
MGQQVKRGKDNPLVGQGIKPVFLDRDLARECHPGQQDKTPA